MQGDRKIRKKLEPSQSGYRRLAFAVLDHRVQFDRCPWWTGI